MRFSSSTRLLPFLLLATVPSFAQMHRVAAPEKVTRAVGVYEWTGDLAKPTAARLIPVSVFIDAQMQDGGTYYARPVPLALESGNIYSLEKAGVPQGTLTLDFARHLQTATSSSEAMTDLGWFGYGTYATMPTEKTHVLKAAATLPKIHSSKGDDEDEDRPTFQRNGPVDKSDAKDKKKEKKNEPQASVTPVTDDGDDPDRPHFSKKPADAGSTTTTSNDPSQPADSGRKTDTQAQDPGADSDRPTLKHRDPKQAAADRKKDKGRVTAAGGPIADDPDRPTMRHGKTAGIGGDPAPQMNGLPANLHQMVAVSDPANREPHPFARAWASPEERASVTAKLGDLARAEVVAYNLRNGVDTPVAPPAATKPKPGARTAAARRAAKPAAVAPPLPLSDEQVTGFTLMYGGLPTFVYTASSPAPVTAGASTGERYVTVVAQQLSSGALQVAFATVTDAQHLDRTPWFRLVDAVDPDASHRASLLFELRGHSQRQFALYSLASAKAEEQFVTHVNE